MPAGEFIMDPKKKDDAANDDPKDDDQGGDDKQPDITTAVNDAVAAATKPLQASIKNLEAVNAKLKDEKTTLGDEFKDFKTKYDGIDIDALKAQLERAESDEVKELLAKGEYDKVYEKERAKTTAAHDKELSGLRTELEETQGLANILQTSLVGNTRENGISQAFITSEADKSQLRFVGLLAKESVRVTGTDGKDEVLPVVEVDNAGRSTFRHSKTGEVLQAPEGEFGYAEWLKHLAENEGVDLYAKPNGHSDPKAITDTNPKGLKKSKMTDQAKREFKDKHGIDAYNALPY